MRKKEDKGRSLAPDSKVRISTLSPPSREKRFQNIRNLNKKFTKALQNTMFQDGKTCLNRKNATENVILDFRARARKIPQKCKHNFHTDLVNALTKCANLKKNRSKKKNLAM